MYTTIKTLFDKGYNKTQIAQMLEIDRGTVRNVLKKIEKGEEIKRKEVGSILDPYKEIIQIKANQELSAMRIFQDLSQEHGYTGSYDTVKKYVKKHKESSRKVYMVNTCLPGEEAQVDFGYIGKIPDPSGAIKKTWIFCMILSYCRLMYCEIVFNQEVKTFIKCHENGFRYFEGVPKTIKIDNLKAAILEANFYEPVYQREYEEYEKALNNWLENICNSRIHGTTKKIPKEVFEKEEKQSLNSIKFKGYDFGIWTTRKVNVNCHISYECNFYSVPYKHIGEEVTLKISDNLIKIYSKYELVATHLKIEGKGQFSTNNAHYPQYKIKTKTELQYEYRQKMLEIGPYALEFFDRIFEKHNNHWGKPIYGILKLKDKFGSGVIEKACQRALTFGSLKYQTIRNICEKGLYKVPADTGVSLITKAENEIDRPLSEYDKLFNLKEVK